MTGLNFTWPVHLQRALEGGLYTDMAFRVGPHLQEFKGHKIVVTAKSEVLAKEFHDRWFAIHPRKTTNTENWGGDEDWDDPCPVKVAQEKPKPTPKDSSNFFDIPDANPGSFHYFLQFLYGGRIPPSISLDHLLEVMELGQRYEVDGLMIVGFRLLNDKTYEGNCFTIFQRARHLVAKADAPHKGPYCFQVAFDFLIQNFNSIAFTGEFRSLEEDDMAQLLASDALCSRETIIFRALLYWSRFYEQFAEADPGDYGDENKGVDPWPRQESLKSLLKLIRFPLMGAHIFVTEVVPTKLLTKEEVIEMFKFFDGGRMKYKTRFSSKLRGKTLSDEADYYESDW